MNIYINSKIKLFLLVSLFLSVSSLNSCKEPCEDYCVNGYCLTGDCDCKLGWMGDACDEVDPDYNPNGGDPNSSSKGRASFYKTFDNGCGVVNVVITDGQISQNRTISLYHENGVSNCSTAGVVNFKLDKGSYSYSASDACKNWSGTFTISANSCTKFNMD